MFYHDHAWGITRLNVYAGEAAGYLITDDTEKALINSGTIPADVDTIPLIVQDRTFVPPKEQIYNQYDANGNVISYGQDPTWDESRWGGEGNFWYHHVYMPAQNPGDPSGMSAYGRWMFGPWFWPPLGNAVHGPIANPYYNPNCNLDVPSTWQYQTDPFCEPKEIPGTPNISVGMEQFNDTPIVNGVAYPTLNLEPKTYRLRMLNAANDRFFNFQWYIADPTQGSGLTEVALNPTQLAAAQTDPVVSPEAITTGLKDPATGQPLIDPITNLPYDLSGPDWIQIGTEGGFLPAPVKVDGQQVTTWITDPTRFDVGNVDKHSLLLAPAERADVIVDFSKFAGRTLILYNDAPAAFPARVPSYDYYTGQPDLSPVGAPGVLPGYGPNTRTIMQVTIAANPPAAAFDMNKLNAAFTHKANGSGVFESGQHPIIVGQSDYNSAYGSNFVASGNCNVAGGSARCDGLVRVNDTLQFGFNTLKGPSTKAVLPLQPKAIHDEMNATNFDEFGRMQANLGVEAQPPQPGAQNVTLYPFVNPATEIIDGTNLPKQVVTFDANGNATSDVKIQAVQADGKDGTQIWRITHNGVDTHPIHFHLYDVQILNRVTWDNIIIKNDPTEMGWKDTIRVSPLEDTIVAVRPIVPQVPWELPNAIRPLNPMMPLGDTTMFNNIDPQGNPTTAVTNQLVNFGWEYVYHCHILSHEEMDMMRPVSLALPPNKPDTLGSNWVKPKRGGQPTLFISWNDNSFNETSFTLQRSTDGTTWTDVGTLDAPLDQPNVHEARSLSDPTATATTAYLYRVVANNVVGYGAEFPTVNASSTSAVLGVNSPAAPSNLVATLQAGPQVSLTWRDNATNETGFVVERSVTGSGLWGQVGTPTAANNTGNVTWVDTSVQAGVAAASYTYRVAAQNLAGLSLFSNEAGVTIPAAPAAPTVFSAVAGPNQGSQRSVILNWTASPANVTGFTIQRSASSTFASGITSVNVAAAARTLTVTGLVRNTAYYFRIRANNGSFVFSSWLNASPFPITTAP